MNATRIVRRRPQQPSIDLCTAFCSLYITSRGLSTSTARKAVTGTNDATPNPVSSAPPGTTKRNRHRLRKPALQLQTKELRASRKQVSDLSRTTAAKKAKLAGKKAKEEFDRQQELSQSRQLTQGGLASNSIFADDMEDVVDEEPEQAQEEPQETKMAIDLEKIHKPTDLSKRSRVSMEVRMNPRPKARAHWIRRQVIHMVRRRGRLTREERIARTERMHTSRSAFFKTSIKKLNPIARQIAGMSIDAAIMQLRFSHKKAAKSVLRHLLQARHEAVVMKGMGLQPEGPEATLKGQRPNPVTIVERIQAALAGAAVEGGPFPDPHKSLTQSNAAIERQGADISDPSSSVPLPSQTALKELKKGVKAAETDMYIDQAWVNRGSYTKSQEYRARGRTNILRSPSTGITFVLKEERTRVREQQEKAMKKIRKRMQGQHWTQLPDRPVIRQSQYVLW